MGKTEEDDIDQVTLTISQSYAPPWRDENGTLYGPKSMTTYAQKVEEFRNWSWRPPKSEMRADADAMRMYMLPDGPEGPIRTDVPQQERAVFEGLYIMGKSLREVSLELAIAKPTVAVYLRRLRWRLSCASP